MDERFPPTHAEKQSGIANPHVLDGAAGERLPTTYGVTCWNSWPTWGHHLSGKHLLTVLGPAGQPFGLLSHSLGFLGLSTSKASSSCRTCFHAVYLAGFGQGDRASCLVYMLDQIFGGSYVDLQLHTSSSAWRM